MFDFISPATLIHLGDFLYIMGFLVRDELLLRSLVLGGTTMYIMYYFFVPETPLWDAIVTSLILATANISILIMIVFERTTFALNDEERKLFLSFDTLNPGQFRKLLKSAIWHTAKGGELLCGEGKDAERLYFIINGEVEIEKGGNRFTVDGANFIGEISFILNGEYTASVSATPGLRYVEWKSSDLRKQMAKSLPLNNAITALFNRDLATKLAVSHQ